jgi:adenylate cyclase class 2
VKYEVEQKFRVDDLETVTRALEAKGAQVLDVVEQVDRYFSHPMKDFARTDEALRIRRVGDQCFVTYKGPKIDATTKTRREIELALPPGLASLERFSELFRALGFQPVTEVVKRRRRALVPRLDRTIEAALDDVEAVGMFVELELTADADSIESAKQDVAGLAAELGLTSNERRSYLELLLDSRPLAPGSPT